MFCITEKQCVGLSVAHSNIKGLIRYYKDQVTVQCNTGHYALGMSRYDTTCLDNGTWSVSTPCTGNEKNG